MGGSVVIRRQDDAGRLHDRSARHFVAWRAEPTCCQGPGGSTRLDADLYDDAPTVMAGASCPED